MSAEAATRPRLIAAAPARGAPVCDPQGQSLGEIKEIYFDRRSGQAEFACLGSGGVLGVGEKRRPLPWLALAYDAGSDGFVAGVDKAALEAGPAFPAAQLDAADGGWTEAVRDYYGQLTAPAGDGARHFTHGASASTSDMAVVGQVRHDDKSVHAPHARPIDPPDTDDKIDHLAEKVERSESRQEALIDELIEESFPASDPPSAKRIT